MKAEASKQSKSRRLNVLSNTFRPVYVVWELTLACDHACTHCGSRAALPRPNELNTSEALELADELIAMQVAEVTLIDGEAYLHDGFYEICHRLVSGGVRKLNPALMKNFSEQGITVCDLSDAERAVFKKATESVWTKRTATAVAVRFVQTLSVAFLKTARSASLRSQTVIPCSEKFFINAGFSLRTPPETKR